MQQLTGDDKERIQQWLREHLAGGLRCFLCGFAEFGILDFAAMPPAYDTHTGRIYYMMGIPLVGLMCAHCGNVVWFSAGKIGFQVETTPSAATAQQEGESQEPTDAAKQGPA